MLQAIRERAQGWIAWVIVILITIPFALWGIQSYLGGGSETVVASVDGKDISERELNQRFQDFRSELRQRLGSAYRPEMFDDDKIREEVLDQMIRDDIVLRASHDMGLRVGDSQVQAAILAVPTFQKGGKFDNETYKRMLGYQGLSEEHFERRVRGSLMTSQLSQVVGSSEISTDKELQDAVKLRKQEREISYFIVPEQRFQSQDPVKDSAVEDYYQTYQEDFRSPEQVKLDYLLLDQKSIAATSKPDEATLKQLYQSHLEDFRTPEQRRASHILVTLGVDADTAKVDAAKAKIEAIRKRIVDGEDFATVAKEVSEDPGSAGQGGDLGLFGRGVMDPAFENAAFSLKQGELSQPVRSTFGYHLIEVTEIEPEKVQSMDEVRDKLVAMASADEAQHRYFDLAEKLGNLTYENPDSLIPAADALGLKVQKSGWVTRSGGGEGVLSNPKVLAAAFSDDVLNQGNNSELIEVDEKGHQESVVVRVTEHHEASIKPLDEVKDDIVSKIRIQDATEAAAKAAQALVERLDGGATMQQVAEGYDLVAPKMVGRNATEIPAQVLNYAFTLPHPAAGSSSYGMAKLRDGSAAVVAVAAVKDGSLDGLNAQQKKMEQQSLARSLARAYYAEMQEDMRSRADVEITKHEKQKE